jgi:D-alanyl-D-alanine carboxypeptidase/D-alanyl-D-alanine-endopeptidase (penicillin-binding protein 4)
VVSLGVAGSSGTMARRMANGLGQYRVRAKTGSLAGACTLSGYVTTLAGKVLAFSILVNGFRKMSAVHDAQDEIAEALVRFQP